ncbi:hypothetical protein F2Q69_00028227 [Brassica cretica]|uniref:Uncharacterized protein n=1 Tax=Brassica cretica TaxID=69181 RepID=A0A8S9S0P1_BRACR|nr:hypothetical protein F2Q69_00028227 [Brassica cretica]
MQSAEMIYISFRSTTGDSTCMYHESRAEWKFKFLYLEILENKLKTCRARSGLLFKKGRALCKSQTSEKRERDFLGVLLIGVEGHSEALSDGVRCGLSLVALELALCMVELAIVYSYVAGHGADVFGEVLPRCGRLKPRLRGSLAKAVSLKWSVKIAAI